VDESLAHTADWPEGDQRFTSFLKLLRSIATPSGIAMDILLDKIIWIWSAEEVLSKFL
jgi:hypothetical protein